MPASSEAQQHTAAMALAVKLGHKSLKDMPAGARASVKSMMSMSEDQLRDFAKKRGGS